MTGTRGWLRLCAAAVTFAAGTYGALPAQAADIIDDWANVKIPPAPELKPVTLEAKTTALLILDMQKEPCAQRPLCVASIPNVKALMQRARAAGATVFYSLPGGKVSDIVDPGLAPHEGEWLPAKGADKFLGSDLALDKRLKDAGIKTVIVCGTSAQGVGIGTGSAAVQRGYKVIYPVDCVSS